MTRELDERRSFRNALETYLAAAGWTGITYTEGWEDDGTITNPQVNVYMVRKTKNELEMGRTSGAKTFHRQFQVDCYMETENRADAITDDIMEFMDLTAIQIEDFQHTFLGTLVCVDTERIESVTQPPILLEPKIVRWRGIVTAPFLAHYPNG